MRSVCVYVCLIAGLAARAIAGVAVSSPSAGATIGSPVSFVASASTSTCSKGVASMGVYINDKLTYVVNGTNLNTKLTLAPGTHKTVIQEWDYCGGSTFATAMVTVPSEQ
jgi:phospholipase C